MKRKPTKTELRATIRYVRAQLRLMFPKHNPRRHPKYRDMIDECVKYMMKVKA